MASISDYIQSFIFEEIDKDNLLELEKILKPDKIISMINETVEKECGTQPEDIYAEEMNVKLNNNNSGISIKNSYKVDLHGSSLQEIILLFKIYSSELNSNSNEKSNKIRIATYGEGKGKFYEEWVDEEIPRETSHTDVYYESLIHKMLKDAVSLYSKRIGGR